MLEQKETRGWKGITTHSKGATDKTPKSWQLRIAGLTITVTRYLGYEPDDWIMTCDPWFPHHYIGKGAASEAKAAAIRVVHEKAAQAVAALEARIAQGGAE